MVLVEEARKRGLVLPFLACGAFQSNKSWFVVLGPVAIAVGKTVKDRGSEKGGRYFFDKRTK